MKSRALPPGRTLRPWSPIQADLSRPQTVQLARFSAFLYTLPAPSPETHTEDSKPSLQANLQYSPSAISLIRWQIHFLLRLADVCITDDDHLEAAEARDRAYTLASGAGLLEESIVCLLFKFQQHLLTCPVDPDVAAGLLQACIMQQWMFEMV